MKYALITGASKGLGFSIAKFLIESGIHVIGLSRTENERLQEIAKENNVTYLHYTCDLGDMTEVEQVINEIWTKLSTDELSLLYVVNNAAVLEPMDQAMNILGKDLMYHYQVNVISPMMLINTFLEKCTTSKCTFIGVTVTSGAADRAVYGWSAYSSSKASINAYTKSVALEQEVLKTGNKVLAFNPGVMDTDMQAHIRSKDKQAFNDVEAFIDYKNNNILKDTDTVAGILVDILTDESNIENGKIYSVRDYF